jgi:hypothetical protein
MYIRKTSAFVGRAEHTPNIFTTARLTCTNFNFKPNSVTAESTHFCSVRYKDLLFTLFTTLHNAAAWEVNTQWLLYLKVKQSLYRPGQAQRVPGV